MKPDPLSVHLLTHRDPMLRYAVLVLCSIRAGDPAMNPQRLAAAALSRLNGMAERAVTVVEHGPADMVVRNG